MTLGASLALTCMGSVALLLLATYRQWRGLEVAFKCLASLTFIGYALVVDTLQSGLPGGLIFAGLLLGALGDVLLLWTDRQRFLAGLVAFLLAHLAYMTAFVTMGLSAAGVAVGAAVLAPLSYGVWRWLEQHVGSMKLPVIAYMLTISAMVATAHGALSAVLSPGRLLLMLGAVLFFASDVLVARNRFVQPGFRNRALGLPLYYGAQLLFGLGASLLP